MNENSNTIDIYGIYVQTITSNEQRRQALSAFYLSLIAAGIALLASGKGIQYIAIAMPISVVALVWFATIRNFRKLSIAKFKVIEELERDFHIKPFSQEWKYLKNQKGGQKIELTHLELIIPLVIFIVSLVYILYWLFS